MVDIESIRQLIQMMVENDLVELSLRVGEEELSLRRPTVHESVQVGQASPASSPSGVSAGAAASATAPPAQADQGVETTRTEQSVSDDNLAEIISPMVGTFYSASSPDGPPYVDVGAKVNPNTVVCIIEAMKVFNEIKAEVSGTIEEIRVANQQAVEYGQPLFSVRRA